MNTRSESSTNAFSTTKLVVIIAVCLAIAAIAFLTYRTNSDATHVRFGITPYQDTAMPIVAQKMGWFTDEGVQVEFVPIGWGEVMTSLESGAIDASIYTFNAFQASYESAARGRRTPLFFSPIYVFKGTAIMIRTNSGIKPFVSSSKDTIEEHRQKLFLAVQQLRGKRIAVTEGTEFEQIVLAALSAGKLNPKKDVQLINASPADALAAFLSGNIDAFGAGLTERIEAWRRGGTEFLVSADVEQPSIDGIITTKQFAEAHPELLDKLVHVWFKTVSFVGSNPAFNSEPVRAYLAANGSTKYSPEEYAIAWTFNIFPDTPQAAWKLFQEPGAIYYWKNHWDANNKFLLEQHKIKSATPYSAYVGEETIERLKR